MILSEQKPQFVGFITDENSDVINSVLVYYPSCGLIPYLISYGETNLHFLNADLRIAYGDDLAGDNQIKYLDIKYKWHNIPVFTKANQESNIRFYPKKENNIIILGKTKDKNPIYIITVNATVSAVSANIILDYINNGYTLANADINDDTITPSDEKYGFQNVNIELKISYIKDGDANGKS